VWVLTKILGSTTILIIINRAANQHINMISEGLRYTEDWSNDAENLAFPAQK